MLEISGHRYRRRNRRNHGCFAGTDAKRMRRLRNLIFANGKQCYRKDRRGTERKMVTRKTAKRAWHGTPPWAFVDQGGELLGAQFTIKLIPKFHRGTLGALEAKDVFEGYRRF